MGQEITIRELLTLIAELTGFSGEIRWDTSKPDGQPRRALDTPRARERFGFVTATALPVGLRPDARVVRRRPKGHSTRDDAALESSDEGVPRVSWVGLSPTRLWGLALPAPVRRSMKLVSTRVARGHGASRFG